MTHGTGLKWRPHLVFGGVDATPLNSQGAAMRLDPRRLILIASDTATLLTLHL